MGNKASRVAPADTRWYFYERRWRPYGDDNQEFISTHYLAGQPLVEVLTTGNRKYSINFRTMKETNLQTGKTRDLKCDAIFQDGAPDSISQKSTKAASENGSLPLSISIEMGKFEQELASHLLSNRMRVLDLFHAIDKDRNETLTKQELHDYFLAKVFDDIPWEVTENVFSEMEDPKLPGRVTSSQFSQAVRKFRRIAFLEALPNAKPKENTSAFKQTQAACASSSGQLGKSRLHKRMHVSCFDVDDFRSGTPKRERQSSTKGGPPIPLPTSPDARPKLSFESNSLASFSDHASSSEKTSTWLDRQRDRERLLEKMKFAVAYWDHAFMFSNEHSSIRHEENHKRIDEGTEPANFSRDCSKIEAALIAVVADLEQISNAITAAYEADLKKDEAQRLRETEKDKAALEEIDEAMKSSNELLSKLLRNKTNKTPEEWRALEDTEATVHHLMKEQNERLKSLEMSAKLRVKMTGNEIENHDEQGSSLTILMAQQAALKTIKTAAERVAFRLLVEAEKRAYEKYSTSLPIVKKRETDRLIEAAVAAEAAESEAMALAKEAWIEAETLMFADLPGLEDDGSSLEYLELPDLRMVVQRVFEATVPQGIGSYVEKATPIEGHPWYYDFKDSALGRVLINERGTVAPDFRRYDMAIRPFLDAPLKGDRAAWGALLTAIFNQWSESPQTYQNLALEHMRYIVFDTETREFGFKALLREDWKAAEKDKVLSQQYSNAAERRFSVSKRVTDDKGVDFFVSHNVSLGHAAYHIYYSFVS